MRITPSNTFMAMVETILSVITGLYWVGGTYCFRVHHGNSTAYHLPEIVVDFDTEVDDLV